MPESRITYDWDEVLAKVIAYHDKHPMATWQATGEHLGMPAEYLRKGYKKRMTTLPLREQVSTELEMSTGADENDPRIASLLAKAEVNLDEFKVTRAVVNEWGKERNYQAKVYLEFVAEMPALRNLREEMLQDIRDIAEEVAGYPVDLFDLPDEDENLLVEVSAAEPHVGKLGWGEEVRDNYDSDIAVERYKQSVMTLLGRMSRGHTPSEFLYVFGSDFMHVDNKLSETTAGTLQDTDTRWHKIFRTSHRLARWTVETLLRFGVPVKVLVIPGNHDELSAFAVGEVVEAAYDSNPLVTVDNRAVPRKYHQHGQVGLGFTHGSEEKHTDLPLIMADEQRDMWATTRFNMWHIGHRHNKKAIHFTSHDQFRTVGVRITPSLCGQDYWHYKKGYRHIPQSEMFVWSATEGEVARFTYTAPKNTPEAA